jgi:hypothetical protein
MTEDEFREMERRMAINRGEITVPDSHIGVESFDASVEWPEHMIEAECTRLLETDGWRALRTDPVSDRGRGKGFGEPGMADHLYIRYSFSTPQEWLEEPTRTPGDTVARASQSQVLWIEFKRPGEKPAKHQTEWHTKERARGALTWIAGEDFPASVAGFVEHYRKSGLNRGRI